MNRLINIDVTLYFEVSNSVMFGGKGTIGYTETKYGEVENLDALDDAFIERQRGIQANILKVSIEDVKLISKQKYDAETKEDEEDFDDDEED